MGNPKETIKRLMDPVPLGVSSRENWYFDNGCTMHMTGQKRYLEKLRSHSYSYVTFGDRTRRVIKRSKPKR